MRPLTQIDTRRCAPDRQRAPISVDLKRSLSDLAFAALELPAFLELPYPCFRLLGEAAMLHPLCRDAARTVIDIAADVLVADETGTATMDACHD